MARGISGLPGIIVSGRLGNVVVMRTAGGLTLRERVVPANPRTPAQMAVRNRLKQVSAIWMGMSLEQAQAWKEYAQSLTPRRNASGVLVRPRGQNVFSAYSIKLLQIDPAAEIPLTPPSGPFLGDAVAIVVAPASPPLALGGGRGGRGKGSEIEGAGSGIVFTASQPNAEGVLTELLVQALPSVHRAPNPRSYRSKGFVGFASGALDSAVPVEPGVYACAYRFVRAATGQDTFLVSCGLVVVS